MCSLERKLETFLENEEILWVQIFRENKIKVFTIHVKSSCPCHEVSSIRNPLSKPED